MLKIPTSYVKQMIQQILKKYEIDICYDCKFYDFECVPGTWEQIADEIKVRIEDYEDYECPDE